MKKILSPLLASLLVFPLLSIALLPKVYAATCTWNGSVDGDWSTVANWDPGCTGAGGIPGDGDDLVFPASAGNLTNTNDIVGLDLLSVTAADAYTIDLGTITLGAGGLNASSATPVIYTGAITLTATSTFTATDSFDVNGTINLNGNNLILSVPTSLSYIDVFSVISGAGNITINQVNSNDSVYFNSTNTYTGTTTVNGGFLSLLNGSAIPDTSCVTVASGAFLDTNSNETIGCLSGGGEVGIFNSASTLTINQTSPTTFSGIFTESGVSTSEVVLSGGSTLTYTGGVSTIDTLTISNGTFIADGTNGGDFSASNTTVQASGILELTNGIIMGPVTSTGTVILDGQSTTDSLSTTGTTQVVINTTSAFGTVDVLGTATVGGTLNLSGSYAPAMGDSFIIVDNDAGDAVVGTFSGLAEGATINFNGGVFTISYVGGTGNDIVLTVTAAAVTYTTTTTLTSSVNPSLVDQCTTLTATVVSSGGPAPTGTVDFYDGATLIGSASVNGSGVATLSVCNLSLGNHNITAEYSGDGTNLASTSSILVQAVVLTLSDTGAIVPSSAIMLMMISSLIGLGMLNKKSLNTLVLKRDLNAKK